MDVFGILQRIFRRDVIYESFRRGNHITPIAVHREFNRECILCAYAWQKFFSEPLHARPKKKRLDFFFFLSHINFYNTNKIPVFRTAGRIYTVANNSFVNINITIHI